ncbi:MAG: cold-shock protein [Beijerinckiaceae bacterium]
MNSDDGVKTVETARLLATGIDAGGKAGFGLNPDQAFDLVEVSGFIKWFDAAKGYGFIMPDDGKADVLLHVTVLRNGGFIAAPEGARIVVEAVARQRGLQAFRVVSIDPTTAIHPSQLPQARTHVTVTPSSGLERAVVKWFNRLRGFGFVTTGEGAPDIFVHMETLRRYGITELVPGETVLVRYGDSPKGLMAAEIRPLTGAAPASH